MKDKLLTGWTFQRIVFLVVGLMIAGQSVSAQQWIGIGLGGYLLFMALFSIGCASGSCKR